MYCGYSGVTGELGAFDHGVYLSLHPDACTPTEIYQGQNMRILMFKVRLVYKTAEIRNKHLKFPYVANALST